MSTSLREQTWAAVFPHRAITLERPPTLQHFSVPTKNPTWLSSQLQDRLSLTSCSVRHIMCIKCPPGKTRATEPIPLPHHQCKASPLRSIPSARHSTHCPTQQKEVTSPSHMHLTPNISCIHRHHTLATHVFLRVPNTRESKSNQQAGKWCAQPTSKPPIPHGTLQALLRLAPIQSVSCSPCSQEHSDMPASTATL